jgi:dipeptidase D
LDLLSRLERAADAWRSTVVETDPGAFVRIQPRLPAAASPLGASSTRAILELLAALPYGPLAMAGEGDLVETSANIGRVELKESSFVFATSQRSIRMDRLADLNDQIRALAGNAGARVDLQEGYPAWQPDRQSPLLARTQAAYVKLFGAPPRVEVIHAGLECGVLAGKLPGVDMISFGPTIQHPHSPRERAHLPSVERIWALTVALLEALA